MDDKKMTEYMLQNKLVSNLTMKYNRLISNG